MYKWKGKEQEYTFCPAAGIAIKRSFEVAAKKQNGKQRNPKQKEKQCKGAQKPAKSY